MFNTEDMQGFYCHSGTTDEGYTYDGCDIECEHPNQLLVDPRNGGNWRCIRLGPIGTTSNIMQSSDVGPPQT